jgi:hypothetical protein
VTDQEIARAVSAGRVGIAVDLAAEG